MPDENEEKKSKEKKQEVSTEVTIGVTNEQPVLYSTNDALINSIETPYGNNFVQNIHSHIAFNESGVSQSTEANITFYGDSDTSSIEVDNFVEENSYGITLKGTQVCQYKYDYQNLFDINIQKSRRKDVNDICSNMKEFINGNKYTNPEAVQVAIATLQTLSYSYYDQGTNNILGASGFTRKDLGKTSEEVLWKLYNTSDGDMLEGFVCSTISDFVMRLLHECNIEAVMFAGGKSGSDHTTLLYKQEDGKYVYVDQSEFTIVEAPDIKDAVKALHRNNTSPGDFGYIMLIDENNSYQEFDLQDETIWGQELDKRDYNQTIAQLPIIENHPSIKIDYNKSLIGGNEINLTGTYVKNNEGNSVSQKKLSFLPIFLFTRGSFRPARSAFPACGALLPAVQ
jgi:hypothetical protein